MRLANVVRGGICVGVVALGCSHTEYEWVEEDVPADADAAPPLPHDASTKKPPDAGRAADGAAATPPTTIRIAAANISSGPDQKYREEGIRILQAIHPDIALLQEFNHDTSSPADIAKLVGDAFGADYSYFREAGHAIPNGVVSRYPIVESGQWVDPKVDNRSFAWAKIAVPGPNPLWAVSVHLLTTSSANRQAEATELAAKLAAVIGSADHVVIGGDFNTDNRTEPCLSALAQIVATTGPFPADQHGNDFTNAPRNHPYDWVLVDANLAGRQVPTAIGGSVFPAGLVFDSQVYAPLTEVAPVLSGDSHVENMQHMLVARDFELDP